MDKVTLGTVVVEMKKVEHNGVIFEVENFLSLSKQVFLINMYLDRYFNNPEDSLIGMSDYNLMDAEYKLLYHILKLNTNIDVDSMVDDVYADSVFLSKIAGAIINFKSFREKLALVLTEIKEQKSLKASIGETVSTLISKGYDLLETMKDISPEQIEKLRMTGLELADRLKEANPYGDFPGAVSTVLPDSKPKRKAKK